MSHLVDTQGMPVADEQQRELYRQLRADQQLVEQAAARRRHRAILAAAYAGVERKELAFALALILDELARHLRDLDGELRESVVEVCRRMARG